MTTDLTLDRWRAALNAQYRLTDCEVGPDTVTCVWSATDDFFQTAGVDDWDRVFTELGEWVQSNRAERYVTHLLRTPETAGLHLQLVREWIEAQ